LPKWEFVFANGSGIGTPFSIQTPDAERIYAVVRGLAAVVGTEPANPCTARAAEY
jgi:hypothetical protein